jgi:hypothetical protein
MAEGLKERIEARLAELVTARDDIVRRAEQLPQFNAAIGELEALLNTVDASPAEPGEAQAVEATDKPEEGTR